MQGINMAVVASIGAFLIGSASLLLPTWRLALSSQVLAPRSVAPPTEITAMLMRRNYTRRWGSRGSMEVASRFRVSSPGANTTP